MIVSFRFFFYFLVVFNTFMSFISNQLKSQVINPYTMNEGIGWF